jgi:hypothetical protein
VLWRLGILAVLLQVVRRAPRTDWREFTLELLDHCLSWPPDQTGIGDAPLCHGGVGVAHIFNRIYQSGVAIVDVVVRPWHGMSASWPCANQAPAAAGFLLLTRPDRGGPMIWEASPAFLDDATGSLWPFLRRQPPSNPTGIECCHCRRLISDSVGDSSEIKEIKRFLDGVTLKHRIGGKPMEIETMLSLGIENADALDAAHAHSQLSTICGTRFQTVFFSLNLLVFLIEKTYLQNNRRRMRLGCGQKNRSGRRMKPY